MQERKQGCVHTRDSTLPSQPGRECLWLELENRAQLRSAQVGFGQPLFLTDDPVCNVISDNRTDLERVPRAATDQPDVVHLRMGVEDALRIDGVLGLTCPRSDDRLVLERWKAGSHCLPSLSLFVCVRQVLERVRVDRVGGVYQQSKAGAVDARQTETGVREVRDREAGVARRRAKHVVPGFPHRELVLHHPGEHLGQPRAHREHKRPCADGLSRRERHGLQLAPRSCARHRLAQNHLASLVLECRGHRQVRVTWREHATPGVIETEVLFARWGRPCGHRRIKSSYESTSYGTLCLSNSARSAICRAVHSRLNESAPHW